MPQWWQRPHLWDDDDEVTEAADRPTEAAALHSLRRQTGCFTPSERRAARYAAALEIVAQILHAQAARSRDEP